MAELSNSEVFTSDANPSTCNDLLQQAFRQVVDEDDNENELVAFLQNDENDSQTIHLTAEQAAALGLTFEVSSGEEVMYQDSEDHAVGANDGKIATDEKKTLNSNSVSSDESPLTMKQFEFHAEQIQNDIVDTTNVVKTQCMDDYQNWEIEEVCSEKIQKKTDISGSLALENICLQNSQSPTQSKALEVQSNSIHTNDNTQRILQPKAHTTIENNIIQNNIVNSSCSQAQILPKLPIILPSSQFIIKPTQTILKPAKNIKFLQSTGKLAAANLNSINTMQSINIGNGTNSVLLSKGTMINNLTPQIIKAAPITAQLLSTNGISAQLLNASHIITGGCEIPNQNATTIVNNASTLSQNIVTSQIKLSPLIKTVQTSVQRGTIPQLLTPLLKNSTSVGKTIPKTTQIISNANMTPSVSGEIKTVQLSPQIIKTSSAVIGKKNVVVPITTKIITQNNSPVMLRTASVVKAQDSNISASNSNSVLKSTQNSVTTVSILKPQAKVTLHNYTRQNQNTTTNLINHTTSNATSNVQTLSQTTPISQQNGTEDGIKMFQNGLKPKVNLTMNGTSLKINKKPKTTTSTTFTTATIPETIDTSKPLGSSENPIQIVQQGQTFHSTQRLTQSQLKQIAHVLQQRSQETAASNEKVVYRVVFPEELDLRIRSPGGLIKNRGGKRGRPKKGAVRPSTPSKPPPVPEDEQGELKDERKKVIARTRSGRLSRPPRHMVRDYKHLHHLDFLQPDLDDSDGGYSDYNTNNDKMEEEESPKELLAGLEVPKRKISDHFRCPTCNKIYLGRTRMARHFEMHPDHGSPDQLPPSTPDPELKQNGNQDPLKRKGKKRGPWAYVTPEAKSERRQMKLKEAISACEDTEIVKIATKPVLDAQCLFDLLVLKSESNVRNFLQELKQLMDKVREKVGTMLSLANSDNESEKDVIGISDELVCDALGINPGLYRINDGALKNLHDPVSNDYTCEEPPLKLQKTTNSEETKENNEERMSSGFSEGSDLSISDFLSERRNDCNSTCPEVLSALTLMRRNPTSINKSDANKNTKLLISNTEIQSQISESPGFQKINITPNKVNNFQKNESHKEEFTKLGDNLGSSNSSEVFCKNHIEQAFIKLEPLEQGFVKLENGTIESYKKQEMQNFEKIQNNLDNMESGSQNFAKGFQKLVSKIIPMSTSNLNCDKPQTSTLDTSSCKILPTTSICKVSDSIPVLQDTVPIISNSCDNNIFDNTENLDITKVSQYDHITHLDILNSSSVIDKNLLIDEKLVEQLHLVDQTNLVDELVSERLKNIMPDNILESNMMPNNSNNLDTDLDFEVLSEEFNRNARS